MNAPVITKAVLEQHKLSEDEYKKILEILGREPNWTELGMFSAMWSEHCSYKSSRIHLKKLPTTGPRVVQGPGENAGAVDIGDGLCAVFKMESHNHPSFIEPYQGAATGVGGILRDIFTMGARPIALLNSLRFGSLDQAHTRHLLKGVVAGIAGYGNCMGVPTVGGEIVFNDIYALNPLVNVFCVGIASADKIFLGKAAGVVYVSATPADYELSRAGGEIIEQIIRPTTQWVACLTGFLFAIDQIILEFSGNMGAGVEFAVLQSYVFTSLFGLLILTGSVFAYRAAGKKNNFFLPQQAFLFFAFGAAFLLAANFFGYVALSRIVFEKCVVLIAFLTFILMVRSVARSFLRQIDNSFHKPVPGSEKQEEERLLLFWLGLSLDLVIFSLCLPLTAGLIGVDWLEVQETAVHAFWGFNIGNVNISLANIAVGLGVFLLLLFVTRMFQKVVNDKILPKTRLESSIRQSLIQLLGYLGLIVSMMAGISAVGFDLSNLALIAGALSVGIGFGLQSIVSNFVSGLILLFERPIKVGDWVVVNSGEGIVKKISVRATEIETFDKSSIIVPNSELISSSVRNWNFNDRTGRIIIPLGVSYDSDPRKVREILLDCAREHPSVLSHPAPIVLFKDFADSALLFELRAIIRNIREGIDVSTDLRFMIWDKLKEENIEIPYPQRDLNVKLDAKILEFLERSDSLKVRTGHG